MLIRLNGIAVDDTEVTGALGVTVNEQVDDKGQPKKSASNELTFYGSAYSLLREELVLAPDGRLRTVPIQILEDCCGDPHIIFDGVIKGENIEWCEDGSCSITATAVEDTEETRKGDCFVSTLVYDDHDGFMSRQHPRMVYCDEIRPEWLHIVVLIMGSLLMIQFTILYPVVAAVWLIVEVINLLIDAVNLIPGVDIANIDFDGNEDTNLMEEWTNLRNKLGSNIIGCGRRHPSPTVRDYINNVCNKCGLTFDSSIINNPSSDYHNTVYFNPIVKKGIKASDGVPLIYENLPVETGDTFLDKVAPVFNAVWRREGSVVRMERRDMMNGVDMWLDVAQLEAQGRITEGVCYKWGTRDPYAFINIGFTRDAMDEVGNEAKDFYEDIVEWNLPYSPLQRGKLDRVFQFGMARFRKDGIENDLLDDFAWVPGLTNAINSHQLAILLSRGVCSMPKLLIWDGGSTMDAYVRRWAIPGYSLNSSQNFNYPFHLNQVGMNGLTKYPPDEPGMALYGRFHHIDNPRIDNGRGLEFNFTFTYTCDELKGRSLFKYVHLPMGKGTITEFTINAKDRTIFVAGTV